MYHGKKSAESWNSARERLARCRGGTADDGFIRTDVRLAAGGLGLAWDGSRSRLGSGHQPA